jgi:long-chain acyl-CoA synthetase
LFPPVAAVVRWNTPRPLNPQDEVATAIVLRPGQKVTADDLRAHLAAHLSKHKIPRYFWFLTESIPRNANGKFLKRQLRETLKLEEAA